MPIEGSLRELSLSELLQLFELSRKTGTLRLRGESHPHPALLRFESGALVGAELPAALPRLGKLLTRRGCLTPEQVEEALREQQSRRRRPFGTIVAARGWAEEEEVRGALYFQLEEAVLALLPLREGGFHFEESAPANGGGITVRIAPRVLLTEAERRLAEWETLAGRVPHARVVPARRAADEKLGEVELQPVERELLALVDGERTLAAIARELGRSELDVARTLTGLLSAGVVEVGEPRALGGARRPRRAPAVAGLEEVERALEAGQLGQAQRLLIELVQRYPRSAEVHLLVGRTLSAAGHRQRAAEAFARAAQQDPLSPAAFYHLGFAAARLGDLPGAEEAWTTYLRLPDAADHRRKVVLRAVHACSELRRLVEAESEAE